MGSRRFHKCNAYVLRLNFDRRTKDPMKLSSCVVAFRTKIEWPQLLCSGMRDLPLLAMAVPSETRQKLSGTDRGRKASSARSRCDIWRWREPCAVGDMTRPSERNLCRVIVLSGCLASFAHSAKRHPAIIYLCSNYSVGNALDQTHSNTRLRIEGRT